MISPLSFEEIVLTDPNEMVAKEEQLESSTESHSGDECDGLWKLKVFCPTIEGLDRFIALGKVRSGAIFALRNLQLVQDKVWPILGRKQK